MVIEGFILVTFLRLRPVQVLLAALFLIVNDLVDYVFGYHPPLPNPEDLGTISAFAAATTAVIVIWWATALWRGRERRADGRLARSAEWSQ